MSRKKTYVPWSVEDDKQLLELTSQGKTSPTIARKMGRTKYSIRARRSQLRKHNITWTPTDIMGTKVDPTPEGLTQPLSAILIQGDGVALKGAPLSNQQKLNIINLLLDAA